MWSSLFDRLSRPTGNGGTSYRPASTSNATSRVVIAGRRRASTGSPSTHGTPTISAAGALRQQVTTEFTTVALGQLSPGSSCSDDSGSPSYREMGTRRDEEGQALWPRRCLIVVDCQNDFVRPNGALSAPDGESFLPKIKELMGKKFDLVVKSRDWHPANHCSFEGCNSDFSRPDIPRWPKHCVQGSWGAEIVEELPKCVPLELLVSKGVEPDCDSASAFGDRIDIRWPLLRMRYGQNGNWPRPPKGHEDTGLARILLDSRFDEVYVCGFVFEVCVRKTALDAHQLGFNTFVVRDAAAPLSSDGSKKTENELLQAGIDVVDLSQIA